MSIIETLNLGKKYEHQYILKDINLKINTGDVLAIIGPTGAGKTTIIKILSTLILPDDGEAFIDGFNITKQDKEIKSRIGVVAGEFTRALYWRLTGRENMEFFAKINGIKNIKEEINHLLQLFDLNEFADERIMKYSTGMKHKLALAISLLKDPPILFLDEPLTGIDPITAYEIKKLLKKEFKDKMSTNQNS